MASIAQHLRNRHFENSISHRLANAPLAVYCTFATRLYHKNDAEPANRSCMWEIGMLKPKNDEKKKKILEKPKQKRQPRSRYTAFLTTLIIVIFIVIVLI